jgi:large subunit ribosomal protein L21
MAEKSTYAVIAVGGKQYRVREGEWLLVDRVSVDEGKTFHPNLLLLGGDGEPKMGDKLKGQQVTAKVAEHVLGEKVIVGKHKRRTGYRRRNGHRSRLSRIEIQSIAKPAARQTAATREPAAKKATRQPAAKKTGTTAAKKAATTAKKTGATTAKRTSRTTTRKKAE